MSEVPENIEHVDDPMIRRVNWLLNEARERQEGSLSYDGYEMQRAIEAWEKIGREKGVAAEGSRIREAVESMACHDIAPHHDPKECLTLKRSCVLTIIDGDA